VRRKKSKIKKPKNQTKKYNKQQNKKVKYHHKILCDAKKNQTKKRQTKKQKPKKTETQKTKNQQRATACIIPFYYCFVFIELMGNWRG